MSISSWVVQVITFGAAVFALIVITRRVHGRARLLGQLGSVAIMIAILTTIVTSFLTSAAMDRSGYEASYLLQAIGYLIRALLFGGGLILLARCVVLSYWRASTATSSVGGAPYGQYWPGANPYPPSPNSYPPGPNPYDPEHVRLDQRKPPGFDGE